MKTKMTMLLLMLAVAVGSAHAQDEGAIYIDLRYELRDEHPILKSFRDRGLEISCENTTTQSRLGPDVSTFLEVKGPTSLFGEFLNVVRAYNPMLNIEVTVHMIEGSNRDGEERTSEPLREVIDQLRKTFEYSRFNVLETILVRQISGEEAHITGVLPTELPVVDKVMSNLSVFYSIKSNCRVRTTEEPNQIDMRQFEFSMNVPYVESKIAGDKIHQVINYRQAGIVTSLNFREGQQVVLGKANVNGSNDALFVVVSARVVE